MGWNFRVIKTKYEYGPDADEDVYTIHEVYYDAEGKPTGYAASAAIVWSESHSGMTWILDKMKESFQKPPLTEVDGKLVETRWDVKDDNGTST